MKQVYAVLIFVLFCSVFTLNAVEIPGGDVEGFWPASESPYLVLGDITVPDGKTLEIESGSEVKFSSTYSLYVSGRLLADGVSFPGDVYGNFEDWWHGIKFYNTSAANDTSRISNCEINWSH